MPGKANFVKLYFDSWVSRHYKKGWDYATPPFRVLQMTDRRVELEKCLTELKPSTPTQGHEISSHAVVGIVQGR